MQGQPLGAAYSLLNKWAYVFVCVCKSAGAATAMGRGAGRSVASAQQVRTLLLRSLGQLDQQQPYPESVLRQAVSDVRQS